MSTANINIRVDADVKQRAQDIFSSLGLDMSTAINVFLRQAIQKRGIPFQVTASPEPQRNKPHRGGWEGKIWMADDFDAPLDDFKEYLQ
ncbi:MAG: type II toxin-antitoxin system RelB/DinJ family antitoxin [Coriobacteriales bacterium]|jgi:DNA-damage-inducible protein J|nr:type II toxin-antitoxin system RelB/DinJ family antitoxin [Coriobacteriales bacterium]